MSARLFVNPVAVAALTGDPMMRLPVGQTAQAIVNAAQEASPFVTGHYRRSLRASEPVTDARGWHAEVGSTDLGAVAIEFGSIHNAAFAPITKGVRSLGLRLGESF